MPFPPGEIPELFNEEEIEGIVSGVRAEVRALGLLDNRERFFSDRVQQSLTVYFLFYFSFLSKGIIIHFALIFFQLSVILK